MTAYTVYNIILAALILPFSYWFTSFHDRRRNLLLSARVALLLTVLLYPWDFFAIRLGSWTYPNYNGWRIYGVPFNDSIFIWLCSYLACVVLIAVDWTTRLLPRQGFWEVPFLGHSRWLYLYHFVIAAVMGLGQLLASPDTWKRVYQVSQKKRRPGVRFLILVAVGIWPYVTLLPFALAINLNVETPIKKGVMVSPALADNRVFAVAALGLVASFLSAFTSALLASIHIQLMLRRKRVGDKLEEEGFYWLIVSVLVAIGILFVGALIIFNNPSPTGFHNPWLLGNMLMGAYAAIAGVQVATHGNISLLPRKSLLVIFALAINAWLLYFFSSAGFSPDPTIYSVNTVPVGVCLFFATVVLSKLFIFGGRKHDRTHQADIQRHP